MANLLNGPIVLTDCDIDIKRDELSELNIIARGGFGTVYKGIWNKGKKNEQAVAAKFVIRENTRESTRDFSREVYALRLSVNCKEYIVQFFGLSQDPENEQYIFVMQHANNGNLQSYLVSNKHTLSLSDKISLNEAILKGLEFLHNNDIVHRDLHSKNVLIHNGKALLSDFGLSKYLLEKNDGHISEIRGVQAYVDSKLLEKKFKSNSDYTHTKASDIYSYGVLMWEIYTCRPPFHGRYGESLTIAICLNGEREKREKGMPIDYIKIYERCWDKNPPSRPKISEVLSDLKTLKPSPTYHEDSDTEPSDNSECSSVQDCDIETVEDCDDYDFQIHCSTANIEQSVDFNTFQLHARDARKLFEEIKISYENVQLNKRICDVLIRCVNSAEHSVNDLQSQIKNHPIFATYENYGLFLKFLQNIEKIKDFIKNVSTIERLKNYIQKTDSGISLELIKVEFEQLLDEFNQCISSIKFKSGFAQDQNPVRTMLSDINSLLANFFRTSCIKIFKFNIDKQIKDALNDDIEETMKFIHAIQRNFGDNYNTMFNIIEMTSTRLATKRRFSVTELLKLNKKVDDSILITNSKCYDSNDSNQMNLLCDHAALLKNLKELTLVNIIEFYGISQDESSSGLMYIVTEKAEYGNLKEFYTGYKHLYRQRKLKVALGICNGLVFLNAVNLLHRDIRSENILIASEFNAKITNFYHGRLNSDNSNNLEFDVERIKSLAPEILGRRSASSYKYDFRSEIYSFGIILWEISNEKNPYEAYNDIRTIRDAILNNQILLEFNGCIPQKYIDITMQALDFDPTNRPTICDVFKVLDDLINHPNSGDFQKSSPKKDNFQSSFLSIDDAVNEVRKIDGNKLKALEYIDKISKLGDPKASYYKAYFLQQKLRDGLTLPERKRIQKEIAHLFKSASDGNFKKAHAKYADCLLNGNGIKKNQLLAIELFKKAASNGNAHAKYRLGIICYEKEDDKEQGVHYLKLAACEGSKEAIDACRRHNINID
ncbi:serine/threonine protein kinase [Gigaspora margarita]|uniref:Serine/threonine protein kinase n=1 Tax=Gigaspora margarita TaxID=4874 RepID=A0A8H3X8D5_GIGMA|nr:serine/threonine protein kinase [Gigaspora margarita]